VLAIISYGPRIPDESDLRLCGDVSGKRVIDLGAAGGAAAAFAARGAKAMAVDPSAAALDVARARAVELSQPGEELRVECHQADLADLGFATSASVDLVFSAGVLGEVDDLARVCRQVHRVLRPGAPLVFSVEHPLAAMLDGERVTRRYGDGGRTISSVFMTLTRANFQVEVLAEPPALGGVTLVPPMLVVRARKLGV
jgi:SAM-dependent methyltransferase